jgi:hypothetical protein
LIKPEETGRLSAPPESALIQISEDHSRRSFVPSTDRPDVAEKRRAFIRQPALAMALFLKLG